MKDHIEWNEGSDVNFDERVLLQELYLSDTEDLVINYIRLNKEKVVSQSIQKTAQELYTVPNTIVRLAKKLGYVSYSEMKFELKQELNAMFNQEKKSQLKSLPQLQVPESISKTLQLFDKNHMSKVAKILIESKEILFLGIGDTTPFCEMFVKNLQCYGISAHYFHHRHDMMYHVQQVTSKHVCLAISVSGETKDVCEAIKLAKDKGATTITLTHFYKNSLADLGDVNLYFWAQYEEMNGYNITDRLGLLLLIRLMSEQIWEYKV
ncbi:MAG: MurR/RpiR family transcriptional regulator [Turicibacter sp.]